MTMIRVRHKEALRRVLEAEAPRPEWLQWLEVSPFLIAVAGGLGFLLAPVLGAVHRPLGALLLQVSGGAAVLGLSLMGVQMALARRRPPGGLRWLRGGREAPPPGLLRDRVGRWAHWGGTPLTWSRLLELGADPLQAVRCLDGRGLLELADPVGLRALADDDRQPRALRIQAIRELAPPRLEDAWLRALPGGKKQAVRMAFVELLAEQGDARAVEPLAKLAEHLDPKVASAARRGRERLEDRLAGRLDGRLALAEEQVPGGLSVAESEQGPTG